MDLSYATLNARWVMDPSKWTCLLGELSNLSVNVATVQETHFICTADYRVQEYDYIVLSAYGSRSSVRVSLLIGRSLNTDVKPVLTDDRGATCYGQCSHGLCAQYRYREGFLYRWSASYLDDPKGILLMSDWNAILDPKFDCFGRGAKGPGRCESSLIDFIVLHVLVERFYLDHPWREMWTR